METFPWEVGDPPDDSGGVAEFEARLVQGSLVAGSTLTSTVAIGRSVLRQMISVSCSRGFGVGVLRSSSSQGSGTPVISHLIKLSRMICLLRGEETRRVYSESILVELQELGIIVRGSFCARKSADCLFD